MTQVHPRPNLTLLQRCYSLLLLAYPKAYRSEYSHWMRQAFDDLSADAFRRQGWTGVATFVLNIAADTLVSAARERRAVGALNLFAALRAHFRSLLMVGALCFALSGITYLQPGIQYVYLGVYGSLEHVYIPGFLLTGLALLGVSSDLQPLPRRLLRVSGIMAIMTMVYVIANQFLSALQLSEALWGFFLLSFIAHFATLLVGGLAILRTKQSWGLYCVVLGSGPLLYWLGFAGRGILIGPSWPDTFALFSIALGWALLALALGRARPKVRQLENVFELL